MTELCVFLHGPNPDAPHRTGGVASWLQYLGEICDDAGVKSRALHIDHPVVDSLFLPDILKRALGSLASAFVLLSSTSEKNKVLHVNTSLYPTTVLRDTPPVLAATIRGIPVFLQVHGGRLGNLMEGGITDRVWHWMCRKADVLGIHPGPQLKEFVEYGYGDKIERMYNVVPSTEERSDHQDSDAHFLYLGRLTEEKGVDKALENVIRLREAGYDDVKMTIAGDGPLLDLLRQRASGRRHRDAIFVEGFVQGEALDQMRRKANIFVLPSRHQEGFPFSFLECAERGMACIVTENSAIPEVFERGVEFEAVDLSKSNDLYMKMRRMVTDAGYRESIGRAGQVAVRSCCTIEAAADRFRDLYSDLARR